jgi:hypothetical protein
MQTKTTSIYKGKELLMFTFKNRKYLSGSLLLIGAVLATALLVSLANVTSAGAQTLPGKNGPSAPSASAASGSFVQGCWNLVSGASPGGNNWGFQAISASGPTDIWAVGYTTASHFRGLAQHWDGQTWSDFPVPDPDGGYAYSLSGVAAVSANDAWAVGGFIGGGTPGLVWHWNGSAWSYQPINVSYPMLSVNLIAVTAVSANDVWAVGAVEENTGNDRYHTLTLHWNGSQWNRVPSPSVYLAGNSLYSVSAISSTDVWAVGIYSQGGATHTLTEHWDGTQWTLVTSPNNGVRINGLASVQAIASNDVWAVGNTSLNDPNYDYTLIEHWDGTQWSIVPSPNVGISNRLYGVTAVSASDVWAVGNFNRLGQIPNTLILHWDGSSWTVVSSPSPGTVTNELDGAVSFSTGEVWTAGRHNDQTGNHGLLEYYSNQQCGSPTVTPTGTPPTATPTPTATAICGPAANYSITQSSGASIVPGSSLVPGSQGDDAIANITLPFTYYLYGTAYNSVNASANGNLQFDSQNPTFRNECLPSANVGSAILAHWDDLLTYNPGEGIFTSVSGSAPNRIFNIEWRAEYFTSNSPVNFEVRLYEGQSRFELIYGQGDQLGFGATIGVQRSGGTLYSQFECDTPNSVQQGMRLVFVQAQCSTPTLTPTATSTSTATATPQSNMVLRGHVLMQGRPTPPNPAWSVPVTLTLVAAGGLGTNYDYSATTDASGYFTVTLPGLAPGSYNWRVKNRQTLANAGSIVLSGSSNNLETGLLRTGDADNNNCVNAQDFNILKSTFGRSDPQADLNGDGVVNASDFGLLRNNFGACGAGPVAP